MSKLLLLKGMGGLYALFSPLPIGAAGYLLTSRDPINEVVDVEHPIITHPKAKNNWEYKREFTDSKFTSILYGMGEWGEQNWNRYIKVKEKPGIDDNRIFLFTGSPEYGTPGWPTYKFTFRSELEEGRREYQGQCNPKDLESETNLCADSNLPEGWTKEKISP